MEFRLLGPLEATHGGAVVAVGGPKQRTVLALLLFNANRTVPTTELVDALWDDDPPTRATATIQVHVSNLRKAIAAVTTDEMPRIETAANGYKLLAEPGSIDVLVFEHQLGLGRSALHAGHGQEAVVCFDRALGLWRDVPGRDLHGPRAEYESVRLQELHIAAIEERTQASLSLGGGPELVAHLEHLVKEHPYRERLRGQLMISLYRSGRQADALQAYQDARSFLLEELGIDPGPELRALEAAILDQSLDAAAPGAAGGADRDLLTTVPLDRSGPPLASLLLPDGTRHVIGGQPCTIGRAKGCSVPIDNANLSRRHAVIRLIDEDFVLTDLGSTNGTLVNGTIVADHCLEPGDAIDLAGSILTFEMSGRG